MFRARLSAVPPDDVGSPAIAAERARPKPVGRGRHPRRRPGLAAATVAVPEGREAGEITPLPGARASVVVAARSIDEGSGPSRAKDMPRAVIGCPVKAAGRPVMAPAPEPAIEAAESSTKTLAYARLASAPVAGVTPTVG